MVAGCRSTHFCCGQALMNRSICWGSMAHILVGPKAWTVWHNRVPVGLKFFTFCRKGLSGFKILKTLLHQGPSRFKILKRISHWFEFLKMPFSMVPVLEQHPGNAFFQMASCPEHILPKPPREGPDPPEGPTRQPRGPPAPSSWHFQNTMFLPEFEKWDPDIGWAFSKLNLLAGIWKLDPGSFQKI